MGTDSTTPQSVKSPPETGARSPSPEPTWLNMACMTQHGAIPPAAFTDYHNRNYTKMFVNLAPHWTRMANRWRMIVVCGYIHSGSPRLTTMVAPPWWLPQSTGKGFQVDPTEVVTWQRWWPHTLITKSFKKIFLTHSGRHCGASTASLPTAAMQEDKLHSM